MCSDNHALGGGDENEGCCSRHGVGLRSGGAARTSGWLRGWVASIGAMRTKFMTPAGEVGKAGSVGNGCAGDTQWQGGQARGAGAPLLSSFRSCSGSPRAPNRTGLERTSAVGDTLGKARPWLRPGNRRCPRHMKLHQEMDTAREHLAP